MKHGKYLLANVSGIDVPRATTDIPTQQQLTINSHRRKKLGFEIYTFEKQNTQVRTD